MPNILHRLSIDAPPERVHALVATAEGIEQWWTGHPVAGDDDIGGEMSVHFSDPANAAATFEVVERDPEQIVWRCVAGPGDWLDTRITYALKPRDDGGTTLLFSHEFACSFWKQGTRVTFMVPSSTYTMRDKKGTLVEVKRKSHTRRRLKPDAWKYHLREMSCADEPLRYVRRFVLMAHEPTDAHANGRPAHRSAVPAKSHAQK